MIALGFKQGKSNPCIYFHAGRDWRTVVHGDDFTTAGTFENIKRLHGEIASTWKCIERGILGPPGTPDTIQDIRVLNQDFHVERRWHLVGTNARHAELVISLLGDGPRGAKSQCHLQKERWRISRTPLSFGMKRKQPSIDQLLCVPPIWHRILLIYK